MVDIVAVLYPGTISCVAEKLLKVLAIKVNISVGFHILPLNELLKLKELVKTEWKLSTGYHGNSWHFAFSCKNSISFRNHV